MEAHSRPKENSNICEVLVILFKIHIERYVDFVVMLDICQLL
jgi:hypothetical protein